MWPWNDKKVWMSVAMALVVGAGCTSDDAGNDTNAEALDDPALISIDILQDGWPGNDALPNEDKADQTFPAKFSDLTALQSPVKSQGSRGVCSIFSTTAYMEHLYIAEGTIAEPDFSEQYLQWSAKFEVGSFLHTSGSNAGKNLSAISDYGIPAEDAWPYQTYKWTSTHDAECEGDEMPTRCYTNGAPPQEALDAQKYLLPMGKWHSARERSIKATMFNKQQGVVVGLTFFYQSWNHRRAKLPTSREYWAEGYVLAPNAEDRRISLEKRAGHSILLVGWDDTLEVQKLDEEGKGIVDDQGQPVMEKGFFIFKNSWGTGGFGVDNVHGDGYGYIAYDYVSEFGSANVSDGLPTFEVEEKICGENLSCDDPECADAAICETPSESIDVDVTDGIIPDNDLDGLNLPFEVTGAGEVKTLEMVVDIAHSFQYDVKFSLTSPSGKKVALESPVAESGELDWKDGVLLHFVIDAFAGEDAEGTWELQVADTVKFDTGVVNSVTVVLGR